MADCTCCRAARGLCSRCSLDTLDGPGLIAPCHACAVDYVRDMHTGRTLEFRGEHAYTQARGRMVAGLYFDPANPMACVRPDDGGGKRLAMQSEKGGLCVGVRPCKTVPGGKGLSAKSFDECCLCSADGCSERCFYPRARGPKRDVADLLRCRENHRRSLAPGVYEQCLYLRCDACARSDATRAAAGGGMAAAGVCVGAAADVKEESGASAGAVTALAAMGGPDQTVRTVVVHGPACVEVKAGERATVLIYSPHVYTYNVLRSQY